MKLLLIKSERRRMDGKSFRAEIALVPDGYCPTTLFEEGMVFIPAPYVAAEFTITGDALDLKKLPEYQSYSEND